MTYFGFLAIFLGLPLVAILFLTWLDKRRGRQLPPAFLTWPAWGAILLHVFVAVVYTTLWDNYLVATGVWYYHPERVTGLTLGWVPIEEYTFFVLQSLLAGFWLIYLAKRIKINATNPPSRVILRVVSFLAFGFILAGAIGLLMSGWDPGTYLGLILVWAIPPIMIQVGWGAHILWHYRGLVLTTLLSTTLFLSAADSLAIASGIWTIDPTQSLEIFILGVLPLEEFIFFLATNTLLIFGVTLALAKPSLEQFTSFWSRIKGYRQSYNMTRTTNFEKS
jgi:lycopene cyclase domain-containing protein